MQFEDPYAAKLAELKNGQASRVAEQDKADEKKEGEGLSAKLAALESRGSAGSRPSSANSSSTPLKSPPQSPGLSEFQRLASQRQSGVAAKLAALDAKSPTGTPRGSTDGNGDGALVWSCLYLWVYRGTIESIVE